MAEGLPPAVGELSERNLCEPFVFKEITWNIGSVSSLARSNVTNVKSPEFAFASGTWDLSVGEVDKYNPMVDFTLRRTRTLQEEQEVYFKLSLKTSHSKGSMRCCRYSAKRDRYFVQMVLPGRHEGRREIAPDDVLIAVCGMHTKKTVESTSRGQVVRPIASVLTEENECHQSFTLKEITWKIPSISYLQLATTSLRSPQFMFDNAAWILCVKKPNRDNIEFTLRRLDSFEAIHEVYFKFVFQTSNGQKLHDCIGVCFFNNNRHNSILSVSRSGLRSGLRGSASDKNAFVVICQLHTNETIVQCTPQEEDARPSGSSVTEASRQSKLLHDYEKLLLSEQNSDVTLLVKGQKFQAHRTILGARSPVFASILSHDMREKNTGLIDIADIDPEFFPDFLRYLYCGYVDIITTQNACTLYKAADKYDVQDLKAVCLAFIRSHIDVETFCDVITLALNHPETDLLKEATDFFVENSVAIVKTVKWQVFLSENPTESNELIIKGFSAHKSSNP